MNIDVILPAGGRIHGDFAIEAAHEIKALIPIGGSTVLGRTLEAIRETGVVNRAVVIGPEEIAAHPAAALADAVLPEGGDSGPANILRGIEWLREANGGKHSDRVLIITTDLPFLTPQSITGFLDASDPTMDLCMPIVRREEFSSRFPGASNFFVKLRDGHWTIGCAFLMNPKTIEENRDHIEEIFQRRKSQIGMARMLGPLFILRFLTGRLCVADIEGRARQILGCSCASIPNCAAELAFDIDNPEEYRYAMEHIES